MKSALLLHWNQSESKALTFELCHIACTGKEGSDTLEGPKFVAKQGSYRVFYPALAAQQQMASKRRCTRGHQRLAACTSSPLTEEEAVQSANLCFQCNKLQWLTLYTTYLSTACAKKMQE